MAGGGAGAGAGAGSGGGGTLDGAPSGTLLLGAGGDWELPVLE